MGRRRQLSDTSSCTVRQELEANLYNQDEGWAGGANCRILVPVQSARNWKLTCITRTRGGRGVPTVGYWFPYHSARNWKLTCITRTRGGQEASTVGY